MTDVIFTVMPLRRVQFATVAIPGPPGPPGAGGTTFVFPQPSPSTLWTIAHNQNRYPPVTVVDSSGEIVLCDVDYVDANTVQCRFAAANAGAVYIN